MTLPFEGSKVGRFEGWAAAADGGPAPERTGSLGCGRRLPASLILGAALASAALAQGNAGLRALFPKANEVAGWQVQTPARFFRGTQVFDYMDGAGEIPRSYGLQELGSTLYRKGAVTLEAAVFDMGSPANAFGYFSERSFLDRSPTGKDRTVQLDHPARLNPTIGLLTFWKGRYTVILQPQAGKPDAASLLAFARRISARIKERGAPPELLRYLPRQHQVAGTLRYLRGKAAFDTALIFSAKDVLGAAKGARAAAVEAKFGGGTGTLAVVQYPSGAAASTASQALRGLLKEHKAAFASESSPATFTAFSPREKGSGAEAEGNRLALVLFFEGPKSPAQRTTGVAAGLRLLRDSIRHPGPLPR